MVRRRIDIEAIKLTVERRPGIYLREIASAMGGLKIRPRTEGRDSCTFKTGWKEAALELILIHADDLRVCCDRFEASKNVRRKLIELDKASEEYRIHLENAVAKTPIRIYLATHQHWSDPLPLPESALNPEDLTEAIQKHCTAKQDPTKATWTPDQKPVRPSIEDITTTENYRKTKDMAHRTEAQIKEQINAVLVEWGQQQRKFTFTDVYKKVGVNTEWFKSRPDFRQEIEEASRRSIEKSKPLAIEEIAPKPPTIKPLEPIAQSAPLPGVPAVPLVGKAIAPEPSTATELSEPVALELRTVDVVPEPAASPAPEQSSQSELEAEVERLRQQLEELRQQSVRPAEAQAMTVMDDRDIVVAALRRREAGLIAGMGDLERQQQQIENRMKEMVAHLHAIQIALKAEGETLEPKIQFVMKPSGNGSWIVGDRLEA